MVDAMVPVLNPAGVQEILEYGLLGIAMSRFSGAWVALKCVHDTVESTASIPVDLERPRIVLPSDHRPPPGGLNIQLARQRPGPADGAGAGGTGPRPQARGRAGLRAGQRSRSGRARRQGARLGVVTTGKSYLDLIAALDDLGIDDARAPTLGLLVYKVGMSLAARARGARTGRRRARAVGRGRGEARPDRARPRSCSTICRGGR